MNRRQFLSSSLVPLVATSMNATSAAAQPLPAPPPLPFQAEKSKLKITGIRMVRPKEKRPIPTYAPAPGSWSTGGVEVANPMSIYPKYKAQRTLFMAQDLGPEWVEITTDKGVKGIGLVDPARPRCRKAFSKLLLGEVFNVEQLWDSLAFHAYYGRKGCGSHQRRG
jgi:L-rhamnonate dehydratase